LKKRRKESMERIIKRRELIQMEQNRTYPAPPVNGVDLRPKDQRFRVLSGPGGFYVYDYRLLDVAKKDGKYFTSTTLHEAYGFLRELPQGTLEERRIARTLVLEERRLR
jgi:hypothetical protein